jgi:hypothetical protein
LARGIACARRPAGLRPADIVLHGGQALHRLFAWRRIVDRKQGIEATGVGLHRDLAVAEQTRHDLAQGARIARTVAGMNPPGSPIQIREVGLRDGLQSLARTLPTAHKLEWIRDAHAAGLREIEVGSFVPARLLPQLADTAELVVYAKTLPGLVTSVLVPNLKDAVRALTSGADAMLPLSASPAHRSVSAPS